MVDEAAPLVDDPELKTAIKPFIQQEAWHAWAHQVVLDHLAEQGVDTTPYTERLEHWLSTLGNQRTNWPKPLQRWWLYRRLADVAALEHFTAVLGQWVIQNRGLDYARTDPVMLDLLRWHGAEEIEHRALVYDVYQNVCGNYWLRAFSMLLTAPLFVFWWIAGARFLMANDPTIDAKWRWRDWLRAARQYRLPGPWKILVTVPLRYMRPSHHPSTEASTQMAIDYLEVSPAARAAGEKAIEGQVDSDSDAPRTDPRIELHTPATAVNTGECCRFVFYLRSGGRRAGGEIGVRWGERLFGRHEGSGVSRNRPRDRRRHRRGLRRDDWRGGRRRGHAFRGPSA